MTKLQDSISCFACPYRFQQRRCSPGSAEDKRKSLEFVLLKIFWFVFGMSHQPVARLSAQPFFLSAFGACYLSWNPALSSNYMHLKTHPSTIPRVTSKTISILDEKTDPRKSSNVAKGIVCIIGSPSFLNTYRARLSTLIIATTKLLKTVDSQLIPSSYLPWLVVWL